MSLTEITAPEDIQPMLYSYEAMGGVIDFVFFDLPASSDEGEYELHRTAAISTLEAIRGRSPFWKFSIDPAGARGEKATVETFMGPHYDRGTGAYKLYGATSREGDKESYTEAFFDPPHSFGPRRGGMIPLRGVYHSPSEPVYKDDRELFAAMNSTLFNDFADLTVYSWSTDWSSYFDPGKEWWGAFLWTVANSARNLLIGIGASTTD